MTPLNKYNYYSWITKGYDDWARQAYEAGDCMLDSKYAEKLESIYASPKSYAQEEHKNNLEFLENLQKQLYFI